MVLIFGDFELDTDRYELRRDGQTRPVEPRVFDLIMWLVQHPGEVHSRDDLMSAVWKGRLVSDTTVSTCIKSARKALGDSGDSQNFIETVRGRGFRFKPDVIEGPSLETSRQAPAQISSLDGQKQTSPSLLILPIRTDSQQPEAERLAVSLAHDIGAVLTRIPLLQLSTEGQRFSRRDLPPTVREIHEEIAVDYVLEGRLNQIGEEFRLSVQLSDAAQGVQLWAESFPLPNIMETALERGVISVIAKLEPQLHRAIRQHLQSLGGAETAKQQFLEASSILALQGWHHGSFTTAADLLRASWESDRSFALAGAYLSLVLGLSQRMGLSGDRDRHRVEALGAAEDALALDNLDSTVLGYAGCAMGDLGLSDRALPILRNAVDINPTNAQAWAALGSVNLIQHNLDAAIENLKQGLALSPLDSRLAIWGALLTLAHLLSGQMNEALEQGALACQRDHRSYFPRVVMAGVHLTDGDHDRALVYLDDARRIKPDLSRVQISMLLGRKLASALLRL